MEKKERRIVLFREKCKKEKVCRKVEVFLPCSRSFSASTSGSVLSFYTRIVVWCPPFLGERGQKEGERKKWKRKEVFSSSFVTSKGPAPLLSLFLPSVHFSLLSPSSLPGLQPNPKQTHQSRMYRNGSAMSTYVPISWTPSSQLLAPSAEVAYACVTDRKSTSAEKGSRARE